MEIPNTASVAHAVHKTEYGHNVSLFVLDGEDCSHEIIIDRPAAAFALIAAATAYLEQRVTDDYVASLQKAAAR